ncbi:MAG: amidohydrolase [Ferruginibacter sp.]
MSTLTISLIQTSIFWEDIDKNLIMLEQKINSLSGKTEVVVLPEMFSTGFTMQPELVAETMDGKTMGWLKSISKKNRLIVTGSIVIKENGNYYNRLIWMQPDGKFYFYDKRHLFAFAGENEKYSPGNKRLIVSVKGWKINLLICYDLRFPVWSRQTKGESNEFDILIFVANWPEKRINAWTTLIKARAIENQAYAIGVNRVGKDENGIVYNGQSMIVDSLGETIYENAKAEEIFTFKFESSVLDKTRAKFPFLKDSDDFKILTGN